jgi:hypothetical protein
MSVFMFEDIVRPIHVDTREHRVNQDNPVVDHFSQWPKQLPKQLPLYSTSGHIESKPPSNLRVNESDLIHYLQGIYEALSY